jgi:outer membrane protein assembly factor BamC
MSARLMVFLGEQEEVARRVVEQAVEAGGASVAAVRLQTIDGEPTLTYGERFSRAWIRVSIALDRLGMIVDEFNRSEGRFYFTYVPREETQGSFFGNLFGGGDPLEEGEQYQVQVEDLDAEVQIRALDKDGNTLPFDEAEEILKRLEDQLK